MRLHPLVQTDLVSLALICPGLRVYDFLRACMWLVYSRIHCTASATVNQSNTSDCTHSRAHILKTFKIWVRKSFNFFLSFFLCKKGLKTILNSCLFWSRVHFYALYFLQLFNPYISYHCKIVLALKSRHAQLKKSILKAQLRILTRCARRSQSVGVLV